VDEVGPPQFPLPVTIRFDLVYEDGTLLTPVPGLVTLTVTVQIQPADPAAPAHGILGEDKTRQEAGKRRQAFYTRLRAGSYQFQLSASSGEDWSDLAVPLRIEVDPDFYQTWWFAALCVLPGFGIAWMILRARMRFITEQVHSRLSERLAERERVARELHDNSFARFSGFDDEVSSRHPIDTSERNRPIRNGRGFGLC
jgi:signal transduction histidine kinase